MITVGMFQGPQESGTVAENLKAIAAAARRAADAGCRILVTPEMSATGYNIGTEIAARAESADGPIFQAVRNIARDNGIAVVYGYPEVAEGKPYNSVQVVDRDGAALANYRKTHLYGFDREFFTPGADWVAQFELDGVTCGLLICYDIEFPENARAHAVLVGAVAVLLSLLLYVIYTLDHPFGPIGVTPQPFSHAVKVFDMVDRGS